jgi:hypothetical protein
MNGGNALEFELDLGKFGAPGYVLRDRADFSGHNSGRVDPHQNTEVIRGSTPIIPDLSNNQFPGMNGMQR